MTAIASSTLRNGLDYVRNVLESRERNALLDFWELHQSSLAPTSFWARAVPTAVAVVAAVKSLTLSSASTSTSNAILFTIGVLLVGFQFLGELLPLRFTETEDEDQIIRSLSWLRIWFYGLYPFVKVHTFLGERGLSSKANERRFANGEGTDNSSFEHSTNGDPTDSEREQLLRSVDEFPETLVQEVMIPRTDMVALSMTMNLDEILNTLVDCGHSRLPVYEETIDEIAGLFYAKDLLTIMQSKQMDEFDIDDFLREPYFVPERKPIADLLREFQEERMHMAIVVDEFGGTAGLITLEDIIEEFFGDIQDEYDAEPIQIKQLDDGSVEVDARVAIHEIEEHLDLELPDSPDYESIGGFLMYEFGNVPEAGETLEWQNLEFQVLEADTKKVISVLISKLSDSETQYTSSKRATS